MFTEPESVAKRAREHSVVRRKLAFIKEEYIAVDPRMAQMFRALGL